MAHRIDILIFQSDLIYYRGNNINPVDTSYFIIGLYFDRSKYFGLPPE